MQFMNGLTWLFLRLQKKDILNFCNKKTKNTVKQWKCNMDVIHFNHFGVKNLI